MAQAEDLIDFNIIEEQKENVQALPSGRSAKALAQLYSPVNGVTSPSVTQDLHASVRLGFEQEIGAVEESDDPLDIYDRYVRWTLDAYPTASATPQSQLLPLLERATKAFLKNDQYKNDARYLKIWLTYLRLFSDAPRETFAYLARHEIGSSLALYYEEFAAWLENAGRWNQAEEVYSLGLERHARPVERLTRKFEEFRRRAEKRPVDPQEPSSPVLPTVRAALAAKSEPFSMMSPPTADPQATSRQAASSNTKKQKMQIFTDDGEAASSASEKRLTGWESLGSIAERRKENVQAAQPWTGSKLGPAIKQNAGIPKMEIFKDQSFQNRSNSNHPPDHVVRDSRVVNPRTGRTERVFVNLELVYPNPENMAEEYCFEELRAASRGWLQDKRQRQQGVQASSMKQKRPKMPAVETTTTLIPLAGGEPEDEQIARGTDQSLKIGNENGPPASSDEAERQLMKRLRREERANRTRRIRAETQTVQTNLDSPKGPRVVRKKPHEATMTVNTRAAMDEVYELFNQPINPVDEHSEDESSENDSDDDDEEDDEDDYTSAGESTTTGRMSGATSEYGEETERDLEEAKSEVGDTTNLEATQDNTGWSEFTTSKHMPQNEDAESGSGSDYGDDEHGGDAQPLKDSVIESQEEEEVVTPTSPHGPAQTRSHPFIPVQPTDYIAPTRPYRDASQIAANRLPFMTPIVEKTESSMGTVTKQDKDYFSAKTPCPKTSQKTPELPPLDDESFCSSPFQDVLKDTNRHNIQPPSSKPSKIERKASPPRTLKPLRPVAKKDIAERGPIIKDAQCNPMSAEVHETILGEAQPPLSSYDGYFERKTTTLGRKQEIQKFCKSVASSKNVKAGGDKGAAFATPSAPVLRFEGTERDYVMKRELGAGAYAPVFLAEQVEKEEKEEDGDQSALGLGKFGVARKPLEAIKMEEPASAWEFYMLRATHRRLGVSRAGESIVQAYEMHLFQDEGYLVEEYRDQGTLLDLVNIVSEQSRANGLAGGMDETLAMFFSIELLRTVEAMHAKDIIHGDLKADNVLVRFSDDDGLSGNYRRDGKEGWSGKGITLIDFGRSIDMRAFVPGVQFIADWATSATDCAEMRELRPWTYQADYHGVAAIAHTMLFGKYIETVADKGSSAGIVAGAAANYRLREGLKRYWQTDIWGEFFALLLNPARHVQGEQGQKMPVVRGMRQIRERMEEWLEANAERGVGLRTWIKKLQGSIASKRRG